MNNKIKIIVCLVLFFFIILICASAFNIQESTHFKVNVDEVLHNGDTYSVYLLDEHDKGIADKNVSVDVIDANGNHNKLNLVTDDKGMASFVIDGVAIGNYTFNCTFDGDNEYKASELANVVKLVDNEIEDTNDINEYTEKSNEDVSSSNGNTQKYSNKYCAICGARLTVGEATEEYTDGMVCQACGVNPYYTSTKDGSRYANQKLAEANPEKYGFLMDSEYY